MEHTLQDSTEASAGAGAGAGAEEESIYEEYSDPPPTTPDDSVRAEDGTGSAGRAVRAAEVLEYQTKRGQNMLDLADPSTLDAIPVVELLEHMHAVVESLGRRVAP